LQFYVALNGSFSPTFQNNLPVPHLQATSLTVQDKTDTLSWNIGTELPINAV